MSSNHTTLTRLALLLAMIAALVLAGCGGDDNGVDQSVHDMALAAQAEAEQKAADEEAARMAAEEEAAAALAAAEEKAAADLAAAEAAAAEEAAAAAAMAAEEAAAAAAMAAEEEAAAALAAAEEAAAAEAAAAEAAAALAAEEAAAALAAAEAKAAADAAAAEAAAAKALMDVQTAAAAAMTAAKTASDMAAMDAKTAMTATANIATLQTGEMSMMMAMDAQDAADGAMKAYMAAKMASEDAAAATMVGPATTAKDMAEAEQAKAEKYGMTASEKSKGAVKYAAMELMIDGTMKSVGDSSIDASMGMLTDTADDGSKTITGEVSKVTNAVAAVDGQMFDDMDTATTSDDDKYIQAVAADSVVIGKTLDTTNDMARVTVIHSRADAKKVRVYVPTAVDIFAIRTGATGLKSTAATVDDLAAPDSTSDAAVAALKLTPVGMHYLVTEDTAADGAVADTLDHSDEIQKDAVTRKFVSKGLFSYMDGTETPDDSTDDMTRYVVETIRNVMGGNTDVTYQHVDTMAPGAPDDHTDTNDLPQEVLVMAGLPAAVEYDHLHFGVWASLGEAKKSGAQDLAGLGIGFVQSIGDGMTATQLAGKATFSGDWVGTVQTAHNEKLFKAGNGAAMLTADFDKDEFEGVLTGLATLEGTLSGNGFSGTKASAITHPDLVRTAAFKGMFKGGIYGPAGEEAGGIFDFSSTAGGAFRGAFGGARPTE